MSKLPEYIQEIRSQTGLKARFKQRIFGHILKCFDEVEAELNKKDELINELADKCNARINALESASEENVSTLRENIDTAVKESKKTDEELGETSRIIRQDLENACLNLRNNNTAIEKLESETEFVRYKLTSVEKDIKRASASASVGSISGAESAAAVVNAKGGSDYEEIDYFDFENHFRGSIDSIKKAQEAYLGYFRDKKHVVDIGCGRGEFLSLMKDNGINAVGVDIYEPYADYCTTKGLDARCGDGSQFLSTCDSVDGIFVGQVVEHLKTHEIIRLCNTAYEKLSEGGCIVIETPNPTSLSIYTNAFYIDPSHIKPVHPMTMQYYLEKAGFKNIQIIYTESSKPSFEIPALRADAENINEFNEAVKRVSDMIFGSQDYAVIAVK